MAYTPKTISAAMFSTTSQFMPRNFLKRGVMGSGKESLGEEGRGLMTNDEVRMPNGPAICGSPFGLRSLGFHSSFGFCHSSLASAAMQHHSAR